MRSNIFSISPLITFAPLLLIHDHGVLAQCSKTWTLPSDGLEGGEYQVFGECWRRGAIGFAWETSGLDGDDYFIALKRGKDEKEYLKTSTGASSGSSHKIQRGSGGYHVVFECSEGGVLPRNRKCERGTLKYKIVNCDCPANTIEAEACNFSNYQNARDVQCRSPPTPPPSPFLKPYIFEYEIKDFTFEPTPLSSIETEKVSTSSNGIIKNCAGGVTAKQGLDMAFTIKNSQSMTVSKSFTSSKMQEVAAGVSVTVKAEAGVIFTSYSVAATANLESRTSWGESATEEESTMIEESSEIGFTLATEVEVEPNTCSKYTLFSNVSSEPVEVPYTAKVYLTVFHNDDDGIIDDQDKVKDLATLTTIRNKLTEYDATIDMSSYEIVYEIEGVYSGLYATSASTETSNCNFCPSTSTLEPPPMPSHKDEEPESFSSPSTDSLIDNKVTSTSSGSGSGPRGGLAVGINAVSVAVGVVLAVIAFSF